MASTAELLQCILCGDRYFVQKSGARTHVAQFHGRFPNKKNKKELGINCPVDFDSCIKVVRLPEVEVNLGKRLGDKEIKKWILRRKIKQEVEEEDCSSGNGRVEAAEKVEIQLDTLGASEIEKLMRNVYKQQPATAASSKMGNGSHASSSSGGAGGDSDDNNVDDGDTESEEDSDGGQSSEEDASSSPSSGNEEQVDDDEDEETNKNSTSRRGRKRKNSGEVEVKLDSLRASEIETLMKGLFQVQDPPKMPYKNHPEGFADTEHVRRSGRRAKELFRKNFVELDSSDEEFVGTRKTGTKRKPGRPIKNKNDPDFNLKSGESKRKKVVKRSSRLKNAAVVIKYNTEDLTNWNEKEDEHRSRYYCRCCRIQFNHNIHYSEHMKEKHGNDDGTFRCELCDVSYAAIKTFNKHFKEYHNHGRCPSEEQNSEEEDSEEKARDYCNACDIQFPDGKEFSKHMSETHVDEKGNIVCQVCKVLRPEEDPPTFSTKRNFLRHRRRHYSRNNQLIVDKNPKKKGPFECAVCKKVLSYWSLYIQHLHSHTQKKTRKIVIDPSKNHECPICQIRVSNITSFKRHFTKHLETNPFRCKVGDCDKTFGDYYHLTKHFMAVHTRSGELLKCNECPARYCNAYYYQRHYREAHKNVPCPIPFTTANPMALLPSLMKDATSNQDLKTESHNEKGPSEESTENEPNGEKYDPTPVIKKEVDNFIGDMDVEAEGSDSANNTGEVQSEQALVSLQNKALIEDPVVIRLKRDNPEGYKLIADLVRLAKSAPKECYKCDKCDWSAGSYTFYERHMKSVHNETPKGPLTARSGLQPNEGDADPTTLTVSCGTCGYQAKTTDELTEHMKEHFGNRKFPCLKCGIRLTSKSSLEEHDHRVHGDGKKFPCKTCGTVCSSQMSLKSHIKRKHGTKENFECATCGKVLTTALGLKEHQKRHTGEAKKSVCQICGQTYATVYVLSRHIQMMHTKTLKLVQVKGKKRKTIRVEALAAAEAELKAAEEKDAQKQSAISELKTEQEDKADNLVKEEFTSATNDCQEIIGF